MASPLSDAANYISTYRSFGVTDNRIRKQFLAYGWKAEVLTQAFKEADNLLPSANEPDLTQKTLPGFTFWNAIKACSKGIIFNPTSYGVGVITSFLLWLAGFFAASAMISMIVSNDEDAKLIVTLLSSIICLAILFIWYSLVSTFTTAATGFPVAEGLLGKKISAGKALKQSLKAVRKTSLINAVCFGIIYIPFLMGIPIIVFVTVQSLQAGHVEVGSLLSSMLGLLSFFGVLWGCLAGTRLALTSQVAIFEAGLPVQLTMNRSSWLLHNGGRAFIVSGFVVLLVIWLVTHYIFNVSFHGLSISHNMPVVSLVILIITLVHTALTTLFLDRSQIIGHLPPPQDSLDSK